MPATQLTEGVTHVTASTMTPRFVPSTPEHLGCRMIAAEGVSHVMPGMQEEAAEKIDAGLRAALSS